MSARSQCQFSLGTLLILMAVAAVVLATTTQLWSYVGAALTLAVPGILIALLVLLIWDSRKPSLALCAIVSAIIYVGSCLLAPGYVDLRSAWQRASCCRSVKSLLLALHNYHDAYGSFPPAYVADEHGKPMHSWRVLVLPFLEQQALYDQYDFSQPWDGPKNRRLLSLMPDVFRCPAQRNRNVSETNYVAVIGPHTAWPGNNAVRLADFPDGSRQTLMLVEVVDSAIAWTEPADLTLNEALQGLQQEGGRGIASSHPVAESIFPPTGAVLGFADGHVEFLTHDLPPEQWRAAFRRDDSQITTNASGQ